MLMDTHVRLVAEVLRDLLVDGLQTLAMTAPWCRERNNDVLVRVLGSSSSQLEVEFAEE